MTTFSGQMIWVGSSDVGRKGRLVVDFEPGRPFYGKCLEDYDDLLYLNRVGRSQIWSSNPKEWKSHNPEYDYVPSQEGDRDDDL